MMPAVMITLDEKLGSVRIITYGIMCAVYDHRESYSDDSHVLVHSYSYGGTRDNGDLSWSKLIYHASPHYGITFPLFVCTCRRALLKNTRLVRE